MQDKVDQVDPQPLQEAMPSLQSPPSDMPLVDIGIEKALSFIG
jgi:hypothetical protein